MLLFSALPQSHALPESKQSSTSICLGVFEGLKKSDASFLDPVLPRGEVKEDTGPELRASEDTVVADDVRLPRCPSYLTNGLFEASESPNDKLSCSLLARIVSYRASSSTFLSGDSRLSISSFSCSFLGGDRSLVSTSTSFAVETPRPFGVCSKHSSLSCVAVAMGFNGWEVVGAKECPMDFASCNQCFRLNRLLDCWPCSSQQHSQQHKNKSRTQVGENETKLRVACQNTLNPFRRGCERPYLFCMAGMVVLLNK
jgi:hypothetical protein